MSLNSRTSFEGEADQQSSSGRTSFSALKTKLSSKSKKASGEDLKIRASVNEVDDNNASERNSGIPSSAHFRKHSRTQSTQSQTQASSSGAHNSSQFQSESHAENPPPLPPEVDPPPLENPLSAQTSAIVKFFVLSSLSLLAINRFLHWSVGLILAATLAYVLYSQLQRASFDAEWQKEERRRVIEANNSPPAETAEWMNNILKTVWPLITPQYFAPFVDLLEDSLMTLVPPIVHSCRVEDMNQGTVPLRIQSFTILDSHQDAFTRGLDKIQRQNVTEDEPATEQMDIGDYINLEVTFAHPSPAARSKKKKSNKVPPLHKMRRTLKTLRKRQLTRICQLIRFTCSSIWQLDCKRLQQ